MSGSKKRQAVNAFVREGGEFGAAMEFDRAARDSRNPPALFPEHDGGDHLHLNDAGHAAAVTAARRGLPPRSCSSGSRRPSGSPLAPADRPLSPPPSAKSGSASRGRACRVRAGRALAA